jgi:predicted HAD superfamily Cof-like phosphohydrolase
MPDPLTRTADWFQTAFPTPTSKNKHTQLGVHFEEITEMLVCLTSHDRATQAKIDVARSALHSLAEWLKDRDNVIQIVNQVEFFDSLLDQIVTIVGVARNEQLPIVSGLEEVNKSNFSKFVDGVPIYDPVTLKVKKGPFYFPPNLAQYLAAAGD